LFLFKLAACLGWSVKQICTDMDSAELSEWMAVHTHFMPLPDPWHQTGVLAAAALAPYSPKGRPPKAADFVPIEKPPQHPEQIAAALRQLKQEMRGS
jgi:hypothetical protein